MQQPLYPAVLTYSPPPLPKEIALQSKEVTLPRIVDPIEGCSMRHLSEYPLPLQRTSTGRSATRRRLRRRAAITTWNRCGAQEFGIGFTARTAIYHTAVRSTRIGIGSHRRYLPLPPMPGALILAYRHQKEGAPVRVLPQHIVQIQRSTDASASFRPVASSSFNSRTSLPPPSTGIRTTIPRPSRSTSRGPSPVRGFMAAMLHSFPSAEWYRQHVHYTEGIRILGRCWVSPPVMI